MASTGLYFLPHTSTEGSPLRDFLIHLTATYNVTPLPRWALEHHIFRETPNAASADHTSVKYLQVLTLSHEPGPSYIAITNTHNNTTTTTTSASLSSSQQQQQRALRVRGADASTTDSSSSIGVSGETAATIASIASGQATDEFVQFLATKLAPLWTMLKMARVANGLSYEVGDFRIRVGELRQGMGSSQVLRGIIVEINWAGDGGGGVGGRGEGGVSDRTEDEVEGVIKGFWEELGVKGAKEVFQVAGFAEGNGTVRQWFEMLRLRG